MIKITINDRYCDNAPKKALIKNFVVAMGNLDLVYLNENLPDNVTWSLVGLKTVKGKVNINEILDQISSLKPVELVLDNVLSHGEKGSSNGIIRTESGKIYEYCNVYIFEGHRRTAKIETIQTYLIPSI